MTTRSLILALLTTLIAAAPASAQLLAAKDGPIVYGHHHLTVTSIDAHKTFWVGALGGTPAKLGNIELVNFPNVIVMLRQATPSGGTKGTTVNHVGFGVTNIRAMVDKLKAAGYSIITRAELPATQEVKDDLAYIANQKTSIAFVMGPDEVKVELLEVKTQATPIAMHHVHFYTGDVEKMKAWYVQTFSANPGMRGSFQAADLPGVNLTFSPSSDPVVGTRGRSLDHIGFEVRDLEAFCKKLEAAGVKFDRPYGKVPTLGIAIAFLTDPFGTYIELTEGLGKS